MGCGLGGHPQPGAVPDGLGVLVAVHGVPVGQVDHAGDLDPGVGQQGGELFEQVRADSFDPGDAGGAVQDCLVQVHVELDGRRQPGQVHRAEQGEYPPGQGDGPGLLRT